ncbi:MAG: arabinogalactan endo-1,4-beta-galactosidase, partial [Muribaculaceae bacterium]|nr:arabinogalactan endo-1,4-beta-galactosidase [Muribaculaceae bacterium]
LRNALDQLTTDYPSKDVMLVETGYSYAWEVPGTDKPVDYPYSEEGQDLFAKDLVSLLLNYEKVTGLFWWWMEYNAYGTSLSGWYNAPLFDSRTGEALSALKTICTFADGNDAAVEGVADENTESDRWYDTTGTPVDKPSRPGLYISRSKKIIIR